MTKYISKKTLLKILKEKGHTEIDLTYHKAEGWWLYSNYFDNWIGGCSKAAFIKINQLEPNKDYSNE